VAWLYGLERFGIKLGLERMGSLLVELGRPEAAFPSILVGGTNGKGSVAATLDSVLTAAGVTTGLYTSPHLIRPEERVRLAGLDIARGVLERHLERIRALDASDPHPSFFEVMTAAALLAFREANVDAAILEVGLGGRLDATNVVPSLTSVVVTVDLDHTDRLGTTLDAIAAEKAGIAKSRRPFVSGADQPTVIEALRRGCDSVGARWIDAHSAARVLASPDGSFAVETATRAYTGLRTRLAGRHQIENVRVAIVALEAFASEAGLDVPPDAVRDGLARTRWRGRLEWVEGRPPLLLDGAHNPAGAEALADYLRGRPEPAPILVFGVTEGKDTAAILAPLAPVTRSVILTRSRVERSAEPASIAAAARALYDRVAVVPALGEALDLAREQTPPGGFVLVAGSLYLVGDVLARLEGDAGPGAISL
jgi:dihydrofolate synthase/folylpolyglutamate synthase